MSKRNVVEILYTDECPFWKEALRLVEEVVSELEVDIRIKKVKVASGADARRLRFPGSPTIRVNGLDIDPAAIGTTGYIGCRIYRHGGQAFEFPPKDMIRSAFARLIRK